MKVSAVQVQCQTCGTTQVVNGHDEGRSRFCIWCWSERWFSIVRLIPCTSSKEPS